MIILKKEQKAETSAVSEKELELINSYARRQLSADEVYVFSVVLCDNEVDRDFERFTVDSLKKLGELFVADCLRGGKRARLVAFRQDDSLYVGTCLCLYAFD